MPRILVPRLLAKCLTLCLIPCLIALLLALYFNHKAAFKIFKAIYQIPMHGRVENYTSHPIQVTSNRIIIVLPPGQQSDRLHLGDIDSLLITRPTLIGGTLYHSGIFKFCDLGKLKIYEAKQYDYIKAEPITKGCTLINDFHHFDSIPQAFPIRPDSFF